MLCKSRSTYPHDEEYASEYCGWHGMQNDQEGPCHSAPKRKTHKKMRNPLFYNRGSFYQRLTNLRYFVILGLDKIQTCFVIGERIGVDRRLRDQAIGHGQSNESRDERGTTKEKEVPMEAGRFLERKLASLRSETAHILPIVSSMS